MKQNEYLKKLHDVISSLNEEVNDWNKKGIKKISLQNMINDLEVVDAELHDLIPPPMEGGKFGNQDNRVCMFYVINRLQEIINKDDECKGTTEFYNELVFNLGINTLRNHRDDWED